MFIYLYTYTLKCPILAHTLNICWMDKFVNRNVIHSLALRVLISEFLKQLLSQPLSYSFITTSNFSESEASHYFPFRI